MRMYGLAAAIGIVAFLSLAITGQYFADTLPEWAAQLFWLALVLGGSAVCGYKAPFRAWRWGAVVTGIQPLSAAVLLPLLSAGDAPSSTGGLVAVAIFGVMALLISPFAILASYGAARIAARPST